MSIESERELLSQSRTLAYYRRRMQPTDMVTVAFSSASSDSLKRSWEFVNSVLIPSDQVEQALWGADWEIPVHDGVPDALVKQYGDGESTVEYLRFGYENKFEPLIIRRSFHDIRGEYVEISEEFRHFHRLYHDRDNDNYIKIDDSGDEYTVSVVESNPNRVKIRLKEIRQFLAIKEMHLAIGFQCEVLVDRTLKELGLAEGLECDGTDEVSRWRLSYGGLVKPISSWLCGFRLVEPLPMSKSGLWGFAEEPEKKYVDFVIKVDENGDEVEHTCDPALLGYDSPDRLTSVDFRKEVLTKYYDQPGKYKVGSDRLSCGSLWSMSIDNHHDDKVCVWLRNLGDDLPYKEQQYWRSFNFVSGTGISETYYSNRIAAIPADSDRPEHIFGDRYRDLAQVCERHLGWPLLRPLDKGDEYHLQNVRVPATNEQPEFDELVLGLSKILIDSLNVGQLNVLIPKDQLEAMKDAKSIARLEAALSACGVDDADEHITFLRDLQSLRSSGPAHRRGREYRRIAAKFELDSQDKRTVFEGILWRAIIFLDYLIEIVGDEAGLLRKTTGGRTNTRR